MLRPSSGSTCYVFDAVFLLGFSFVHEDAKFSSETSVDFQEMHGVIS
jgi:hypothetical protein